MADKAKLYTVHTGLVKSQALLEMVELQFDLPFPPDGADLLESILRKEHKTRMITVCPLPIGRKVDGLVIVAPGWWRVKKDVIDWLQGLIPPDAEVEFVDEIRATRTTRVRRVGDEIAMIGQPVLVER